jgi:FtsH-binding integral membrane protein
LAQSSVLPNQPATVSKISLMGKVNILLVWSLILGGAGACVGMHANALVAFLCWGVSFLILLGMYWGGKASAIQTGAAASSICLMSAFVALFGVFVGYGNIAYVRQLGENTVFWCYMGTAGFMTLCCAVVSVCQTDFRRWEAPLYLALLAMIVVGLVGVFIHFGPPVMMLYSGVGMVLFTGFFLVDLCRYMRSGVNTWGEAVDITINLYLDFINFAFYLMQFLSAAKSKD